MFDLIFIKDIFQLTEIVLIELHGKRGRYQSDLTFYIAAEYYCITVNVIIIKIMPFNKPVRNNYTRVGDSMTA